jgi:hypothetical protein
MKRRIENPKILLLDCNLEYKKGESQTNIEIMKEDDFSKILEMEEAYIKKICDDIIRYSPDLVGFFVFPFMLTGGQSREFEIFSPMKSDKYSSFCPVMQPLVRKKTNMFTRFGFGKNGALLSAAAV